MVVRVVFEVSCPTISSEAVCLVGSIPELGSMDPADAVPLQAVDGDYSAWRTAELTLPNGAPKAVHYKYIKIFGGSVVQWEAGPDRVLELSELSKCEVNYMEDVMYDIDDNIARRNSNGRIRFEEQVFLAKSQSHMTSLQTSVINSSIASPRRTSANPTPLEKTPGCRRELDGILRELIRLESMGLPGRMDIRRAITAVRAAIEAEQKGGARARGACAILVCVRLSLLLVPLLPLLVASVILWTVPSARRRKAEAMQELRAALAKGFEQPSAQDEQSKRHALLHHRFRLRPSARKPAATRAGFLLQMPLAAGLRGLPTTGRALVCAPSLLL